MLPNPAPLTYSNAVLLCECDDLSMISDAQWEALKVSCKKYRLTLPDRAKRQKLESVIQVPDSSQEPQVSRPQYPGADPFGQEVKDIPCEKSEVPGHAEHLVPLQEDKIEPEIAPSDLWPAHTCIYSEKFALRESDAVLVLTASPISQKAEIRPFQGWTPSKERLEEIWESNPKAAVVSLLLASWMRDADIPMEIYKTISTSSASWASTRHRTSWMYLDADASWTKLRSPIRVREPGEVDPWNFIFEADSSDPKECVMGWLHLDPIVPLCDISMMEIEEETGPLESSELDQGLQPLPLKINELPGVCYNGR